MFVKKRKYQMNKKQADATLQKVFAACSQPPNKTAFDKLLLRRQADTGLLDHMMLLTAVILLLTLLSPLVIASVNMAFPPAEGQPAVITDASDSIYTYTE